MNGRTDVKVEHVNALLTPTSLSAADRCDRCGAQAYVRATLHGGGELFFCAHHARKHIPALRELAHIHDETDRLSATGSAELEER